VPKRDEELEFDFEDEEAEEEYSDEEGYEDDEYSEEDDEYDDEDEDDEDDDAPASGGWMRKAIFAVAGVVALGAGAFAYFQGMLPFSPKQPQEIAVKAGEFANKTGMGKVAPVASPGVPSMSQITGKASTSVPAQTAAEPAPVEQQVAVKAEKPAEPAKPAAPQPARPVAQAPAKPAPVPATQPVLQKPVAQSAAQPAGSGHFTVQCGAFASADNANHLAQLLSGRGFEAWVFNTGSSPAQSFSVRSTVVNSRRKAEILKNKFASAGHPAAVVPAGRGRYVLQLGIFSTRERADALAGEIRGKGMFVSVAGGSARLTTPAKVMVGKYATQAQAAAVAGKVRHQGVPAIVVKI